MINTARELKRCERTNEQKKKYLRVKYKMKQMEFIVSSVRLEFMLYDHFCNFSAAATAASADDGSFSFLSNHFNGYAIASQCCCCVFPNVHRRISIWISNFSVGIRFQLSMLIKSVFGSSILCTVRLLVSPAPTIYPPHSITNQHLVYALASNISFLSFVFSLSFFAFLLQRFLNILLGNGIKYNASHHLPFAFEFTTAAAAAAAAAYTIYVHEWVCGVNVQKMPNCWIFRLHIPIHVIPIFIRTHRHDKPSLALALALALAATPARSFFFSSLLQHMGSASWRVSWQHTDKEFSDPKKLRNTKYIIKTEKENNKK